MYSSGSALMMSKLREYRIRADCPKTRSNTVLTTAYSNVFFEIYNMWWVEMKMQEFLDSLRGHAVFSCVVMNPPLFF